MVSFVQIPKALADSTRLRVLLALRQQELCACQITELFGLAQSTMSKHFSLLKQAGLVESRKDGRWVYYRLPQRPSAPVREALKWVFGALKADPCLARDEGKMKKILKCDPAEICRRQCGR